MRLSDQITPVHGIKSINHISTHGYTGHAMLLCVPLFTCLHVPRSGVAQQEVKYVVIMRTLF